MSLEDNRSLRPFGSDFSALMRPILDAQAAVSLERSALRQAILAIQSSRLEAMGKIQEVFAFQQTTMRKLGEMAIAASGAY